MDQTLLITLLGLAMNAVIVVFVILAYFRRLATKEDVKALSDRLDNVETRLGKVETGLAALETRQDGFEKSLGEIQKTANTALQVSRDTNVEVRVMQASILRLESYFETPKLKSS
ncbi:MAG: hypothetical protein OXI62_06395 [Chloroflexota bacterium]|nr:hypothetical protein [Chloroflexota bacterium]MDE2650331.1 hypothetical protein [Chloroflexota bacterium]MXV92316.1 hypothetical protein [Chloroflexota bacterium]MXX51416.1 hypothetical protein [Chloroflexota bacterium]MXX83628.1 hypothetical protein [Chloroflexota bacterium]